jgi:ankyrin repeat protein
MVESGGIDQRDFVAKFPLPIWTHFNNMFEKFEVRRYTSTVTLAYILAEKGLSHLARMNPLFESYHEVGDERYGTPFFAAMATGNDNTAQLFLESKIKSIPLGHVVRQLYNEYCRSGAKIHCFRREFKFAKKTVETHLPKEGNEAILALLQETGQMKFGQNPVPELIFRAARAGNYLFAKVYIEDCRQPVNATDAYGRTALSYAAENSHTEIVKLFTEYPEASIEFSDNTGRTPLSYAASGNSTEAVKLLSQHAPTSLDLPDVSDKIPLTYTVSNSPSMVKTLIQCEVDVNRKSDKAKMALMLALRNSKEDVFTYLLSTKEIEIDTGKDRNGRKLVFQTVERGWIEATKILLRTGNFWWQSKDHSGQTLLSWAVANHNHLFQPLLETGSDLSQVDAEDKDGLTPLSWAAKSGSFWGCKYLIETNGVDVNSKDNTGRTPLLWAVEKRDVSLCELFCHIDEVDVNSKDDTGRTPLLLAAEKGNAWLCELFCRIDKVDVNSRDGTGLTSLSWAAGNGYYAVCKVLTTTLQVAIHSKAGIQIGRMTA